MTNVHRGELSIDLLGGEWDTRLTIQAIARIEGRLGIGVMALARRIESLTFGLNDIAVVIHEAIRAVHDDAPDLETVTQAVLDEGLAKCAAAAGQLLALALVPEQAAAEDAKKKT